MADVKNKAAPGIVLGLIRGKGGGDNSSKDEMGGDTEASGDDEALSAAGDDVMQALKEGDPESFTTALKSFIELCSD